MIALPPSLAGAVNVMIASALPGVALTAVGAPGTVIGVTALDGDDAGPGPASLVAVTVNVYAVPLTRPLIVCGVPVVPALSSVPPAGIEATV